MGAGTEISLYLIRNLGALLLFVVILRGVLHASRVNFYNPLSQMIVKLTNPLLTPLRGALPAAGRIDWAVWVLAVLGGVRGAAIIEDHTESYAVRVAACVPPACHRLTPGRWAGGKALGLAGRGVRHSATGRALPESAGRVHRVRKL